MARLKGRDNLADIADKLSGDFRSVALSQLHVAFYSAVTDTKRAATVLAQFYQVAGKLSDSENDFNKRARPASAAPSLMTHLRGSEHMQMMREFENVKAALIELDPANGQQIVELAEHHIAEAPRPKKRGNQPGAGLN